MPPVFGIAGFKNVGKTLLTVRLVAALSARGYAVSTVKHAHHSFEIDYPGRDSHRHREAGAREVAIVSRNRWALVHELRDEPEPPLDMILAKLGACDIVIVEGYRHGPHPKIEVRRSGLGHRELAGADEQIVAIASDRPLENEPVRVFDIDDIAAIADLVLAETGLEKDRP